MLELLDTRRKDEAMSTPITDKRGRVVHLSALGFKPLCKPHTRAVFHSALIGANGSKLCPVCAEKDLQARYENGER
jgi:hypothetical protein